MIQYFEPILRIKTKKQILDINKDGITEIYRMEVQGENTVNLLAGFFGLVVVLGVFVVSSMKSD